MRRRHNCNHDYSTHHVLLTLPERVDMDPDIMASISASTLAPPPGPPLSASPTPAPPTPNIPSSHSPPVLLPVDIAAQLAEAQARITQLSADNDFLRARYADVDAFATSARAELATLRESEALARSQATDGVGLVRGMFENRVAFLEGEVARLQRGHGVQEAQGRHTGDELRERAARVEEMEAEVSRWRRRAGNAEREAERLKEALEVGEDGEYQPPGETAGAVVVGALEATASTVKEGAEAAASKMDSVIAGFLASECVVSSLDSAHRAGTQAMHSKVHHKTC
jgi:hypothetical protein